MHKSDVFPTKLTFSAEQLKRNLKDTGGFLPLLASLLIPVIGGAIGGVMEKSIAGGGMDMPILNSQPGGTLEILPSGEGLYLSPWPGKKPTGYGLWEGEHSVRHSSIHHSKWSDAHKKLLKSIL